MELSGIKYIHDFDYTNRIVFVRVDFNVPLKGKEVADDGRIRAALPTINALREQGAKLILASHLGRPKGQRVPALSMIPIGKRLAELLESEVTVADNSVGDGVARVIATLPKGGVLLLENLRFNAAEKKGDPNFAAELVRKADYYINDAFGTAHRAHASTYTAAKFFDPDHRAAGFLIAKELENLGPLLSAKKENFIAILGGAKVSDKIKVIENLLGKVDTLLIGGAMAYTFLLAQKHPIGTSLCEEDKISLARKLLLTAERRETRIILPIDHVVASSIEAEKGIITEGIAIEEEMAGFDIGPKTIELFEKEIRNAKTIFWNGPSGVFERKPFRKGTFAIANAIADSSAFSVIGGGDSASALRASGRADDVSHVSTGGGASLEFMEGKILPGIAALRAGYKFD